MFHVTLELKKKDKNYDSCLDDLETKAQREERISEKDSHKK